MQISNSYGYSWIVLFLVSVDDASFVILQLEESDKLLKRKQRFGVTVTTSPGDSNDVSSEGIFTTFFIL